MTQTYKFLRSPHIKTANSMQRIIRSPPIVGVPALPIWVLGPSSLICWVMLNLLSLFIIHGPIISAKTIAVSTAREVLNVIYLNTFRGENQSCRLYKRLYNIMLLYEPSARTLSIFIPLEPFIKTVSPFLQISLNILPFLILTSSFIASSIEAGLALYTSLIILIPFSSLNSSLIGTPVKESIASFILSRSI